MCGGRATDQSGEDLYDVASMEGKGRWVVGLIVIEGTDEECRDEFVLLAVVVGRGGHGRDERWPT